MTPPINHTLPVPTNPSLDSIPAQVAIIPKPNFNPFLTPEPPIRPSLKRSRSSPTLSPPVSSNANPFAQTLSLFNPQEAQPPDPISCSKPTFSPSSFSTVLVGSGPPVASEDPLLPSQ